MQTKVPLVHVHCRSLAYVRGIAVVKRRERLRFGKERQRPMRRYEQRILAVMNILRSKRSVGAR